MMEDKLRLYLWWKGKLSERKADGKGPFALPKAKDNHTPVSEALKKKDEEMKRSVYYSLEPLAHALSAWWIDCNVVCARLKSVLL